MNEETVVEQTLAYPETDESDDLDLTDDSRFRPSRATVGLVCAIVAVLVFMGGALVQKHWGTSSGAGGTAGGATAFAGARAGGYGQAGGFPGGAGGSGTGTGPGGAGGTAPGGTAPGGTAPGGTAAAGGAVTATPVVVGTVSRVSSSHMIVKNLGGKSVTVKLPSGVTISLVKAAKLPSLAKGATVSVAGKAAADGTVTATTVTVR